MLWVVELLEKDLSATSKNLYFYVLEYLGNIYIIFLMIYIIQIKLTWISGGVFKGSFRKSSSLKIIEYIKNCFNFFRLCFSSEATLYFGMSVWNVLGETWFSRLLFKIDYYYFQGLNKFTFYKFSPSFIKFCLLVGVLDKFRDFSSFRDFLDWIQIGCGDGSIPRFSRTEFKERFRDLFYQV